MGDLSGLRSRILVKWLVGWSSSAIGLFGVACLLLFFLSVAGRSDETTADFFFGRARRKALNAPHSEKKKTGNPSKKTRSPRKFLDTIGAFRHSLNLEPLRLDHTTQ